MPAEFMKRLVTDGSAATLEHFAKAQIAGRDIGLEKSDWIVAIQKRADELFPNKPSPQQRFARALDTDPTAQLLYRACKMAPGSEVRPPIEKEDDGPRHAGPASAKMHSLAVDRQRSRGIPFFSAYYETYIHPNNQALREQVKSEELERAMSGLNSDSNIHTLSIQEARRDAKPFPASAYGSSQAKKSAEAELAKLADRYRESQEVVGKKCTPEMAFSKVLMDPQNVALRKAALAVA